MSQFPAVDRAVLGRPVPDRHVDDFYRTPPWATRALLDREEFPGEVWEPACGDGAIARVLAERGYVVHASDLHERGYGVAGLDCLTAPLPSPDVRSLVTNPPFHRKLPEQLALRCADLGLEKWALLLRLSWLEGAGRGQRVFNGHTPLARVHVFSTRCNVRRDGFVAASEASEASEGGQGNEERERRGDRSDHLDDRADRGGLVAFAWYVWERGWDDAPRLDWVA